MASNTRRSDQRHRNCTTDPVDLGDGRFHCPDCQTTFDATATPPGVASSAAPIDTGRTQRHSW